MIQEKRKEKRFALDKTVQAINSLNGRSLGVLINISAGGFMTMCGEHSPRRGDILQLHLLDPKEKTLDITVGVTCVWQEEASATDSYWCGFKFIDVSPEASEALDNFIESLQADSQ